jgi:hypothetical protein
MSTGLGQLWQEYRSAPPWFLFMYAPPLCPRRPFPVANYLPIDLSKQLHHRHLPTLHRLSRRCQDVPPVHHRRDGPPMGEPDVCRHDAAVGFNFVGLFGDLGYANSICFLLRELPFVLMLKKQAANRWVFYSMAIESVLGLPKLTKFNRMEGLFY